MKRRLNVGILLPGFSADEHDWAIPVQQNLVREMAKHADVRVIATRYPHTQTPYAVHGAEVYPLGAGAWARKLARFRLWRDTLRLIRRLHKKRPFDVLHAMWADETGLLANWAGKWLNIPVVVSIAGGELVGFKDINYGLQRSAFSRWTVAQALYGADAVVVACDYVENLLIQRGYRIPPDKIHTIALGVDTNVFRPDAKVKTVKNRLIHAASLVGVKDQATLLRAVARLPETELLIIGEGNLRADLQALAKNLHITQRVTFAGAIHHLELPRHYQTAALNVLTSRHEGLGMVTLEAAACGVPTISTHVGLLPDVPEMGVTVPVGDDVALADAINTLLNDDEKRAELTTSARKAIKSTYTIQHTVDDFLQLYRTLIG
ncbi:MAG: glycosyltransferase family 4 protein [Aggregatilineales bacterium]